MSTSKARHSTHSGVAAAGTLSGDMLTERLQDYGQVGGLLRLRLVDAVYRLTAPPARDRAVQSAGRRHLVAPPRASSPRRRPPSRDGRPSVPLRRRVRLGIGRRARPIGFLSEARKLVGEQLKAAGFDALELVELRLQGEELATLDDFEELLAVDVANVDRMPHQEAVARHALSRLRGRAVLADEVGLGKTIEAGLAIKELTLRGLAKRVLILCPAPLRDQWRDEMSQKFDLAFDVAYRGPEMANQEKLILSLTLGARQSRQADQEAVGHRHRRRGASRRRGRCAQDGAS